MKRWKTVVWMLVVALPGILPCHAANHALLVGVDDYQDRNRITPLSAAGADAKSVALTLREVAGYPADNIRVLTSDGETKPTGTNILFELDQLAAKVKPGDNVFVLFSGHGVQIGEDSYLLPYDTDGRSDSTLKRSAVPTSSITEALAKLPANALIMAYDMCRSNPRKGARDVTPNNTLGVRQAKDLVLVPANTPQEQGPRAAVTLFSCSPKERSYEWADKGRGYFSYFLELGLRSAAADEGGTVRVKNLVGYLEKAVYGAVQRDQGESQTPYVEVKGTGATELVLAAGRPASKGGTTAVVAADNQLEDRYAASLQRGFELLQDKLYDAAQDRFEEALKADPKSSRAAFALGKIHAEWGQDREAAEKFYRQAVALDLNYAKPLLGLAELYYSAKRDPIKGVTFLKQALAISPDDAELVAALGFYLYDHVRDYAEAEKQLLRAIELDPKLPEPIAYLGLLTLTRKHDFATAEALFQKAVSLDSKNVQALGALGIVRAAIHNDIEGAQKLVTQAMQISPKNAQLMYAMGMVHQLGGNMEQAEQYFRTAITTDPLDPDPLTSLATLVTAKGNAEEAAKLLQKAIELDPLNAEPIMQLGTLVANRGDAVTAEKLYRHAIKVDPKNAAAVFALATIADDVKKDRVEAERLYLQAIELDSENAMALNRLGNLNFWHKKDYAEAERLFRLSMTKGPMLALPVHNLGVLLMKIKKDYPAAEKALRQAIALVENNPGNMQTSAGLALVVTYRTNLVQCLTLQNRTAEAKAEAQKVTAMTEQLKKVMTTEGIALPAQPNATTP
jgi:Tfp pilus assembly protein PilF